MDFFDSLQYDPDKSKNKKPDFDNQGNFVCNNDTKEELKQLIEEEKQEKIKELDKKIWDIQRSTKSSFGFLTSVHDNLRQRFNWYYWWHTNPYANAINAFIVLMAFLTIGWFAGQVVGFWGQNQTSQAAAGINKMINYQGKLTSANDIPVADGSYNMQISIWDSESGGSCLWAWKGSCGSPSNVPVTVSNGIFSVLLGDTGYQSTNALTLAFNDDSYWLQVIVGGETLTPRRRIGAVGYAYNSDTLDGYDEDDFALLAGRSSGQTLIGGTGTTDDLVLQATSGVGVSGSDIILKVGNNGATEAMRILYNGKIGVGTDNPSYHLEIADSGAIISDNHSLHVENSQTSSSSSVDIYAGYFSMSGYSSDSRGNSASLYIQRTGDISGASKKALTINADGTGDSNYGAQIYVSGSTNMNIGLWASAVGATTNWAGYFVGDIYTQGLNINGSYTLPTSDGTNGYVLTTNGSGTVSWAAGSGGSSYWSRDTGNGEIYPTTLTDEVGIGTTNPDSVFHIYKDINSQLPIKIQNSNAGSSATVEFAVQNNLGVVGYFGTVSSTYSIAPLYTGNFFLHSTNNRNLVIGTEGTSGDIVFHTSSGLANFERMRIYYSGKTTIGTPITPSSNAILTVSGSGHTAIDISAGSTSNPHIGLMQGTTDKAEIGWDYYGNHIYIGDAGTSTGILNIDTTDDKVGVGTSTPTEKLDVFDNVNDPTIVIDTTTSGLNPTLRFEGDASAAIEGFYIQYLNAVGTTEFYNVYNATDAYRWYAAGTQRLTLQSDGDLGLGTNSPSYHLDIADSGAITTSDRTLNVSNTQTSSSASVNIYGGYFSVSGSNQGFSAQKFGVYSTATGVSTGANYGIFGYASNTTSGDNYGVYGYSYSGDNGYGLYGMATGGTTNYGVYASASGGTTNWAGYFNGDVKIFGSGTTSYKAYFGDSYYWVIDSTNRMHTNANLQAGASLYVRNSEATGSAMWLPNGVSTASATSAVWDGNYLKKSSSSSLRYKTDIESYDVDLDKLSDVVLSTYKYNREYIENNVITEATAIEKGRPREELINEELTKVYIGVIAEDLAKLHPDLVIYDEDGNIDTINDTNLSRFTIGLLSQIYSENQTDLISLQDQITQIQGKINGNVDLIETKNLVVSEKITTKNLLVTGVIETNDIQVNGHILGSNDTRGELLIPAGQTEATFEFDNAYNSEPIVTISQKINCDENTTPKTCDPIYNEGYAVETFKDKFILYINSAKSYDLMFNWSAQE